MVIVGLSGTIDSLERLESVVDVDQMLDERYNARKRYERLEDNNPESLTRIQASGSAVIAIAKISTFLSNDDFSNISLGHASRTKTMLRNFAD